MRVFAFSISMVRAPNGKRWHQEGTPYYKIRAYSDDSAIAERLKLAPYYYYDLKDGWGVGVFVYELKDVQALAHIQVSSRGFLCYEWMIDSIEQRGKIISELSVRLNEAKEQR